MWVEFSTPQISLVAGFDSVEASVPQTSTAGTLAPLDYFLDAVPQISLNATDWVSGPVVAMEGLLPNVEVQSALLQQPFAAAEIVVPQVVLETSTNETDIPAPQVVIVAELLGGDVFSAANFLPQITVAASASAGGEIEAAAVVQQVSTQSELLPGRVLSGAIEVPNLLLQATLTPGGASAADFSVAQIVCVAEMSGPQFVSVAVSVPQVLIVADMVSPVTAADKLFAMNTNMAAVTEFAGWGFNSFASFGGKNFAAGAAGIFEIDNSDTDASAAIAASFESGDIDFGDTRLKNVNRVFAEGVFGGDMELDTIMPDGAVRTYLVQGDNSPRVAMRIVRTGERPLATRWRFRWRNRFGAGFRVVRLIIRPSIKDRRVANGDR